MDIENHNTFIYSFNVVNNAMFYSFRVIIENILNLNFDKAYYALNSNFNGYSLADIILKKANKNDINNDVILSFNNIVEAYDTSVTTLHLLKDIRGDNSHSNNNDIQIQYNNMINNNVVLCAYHKLSHINIIKNIQIIMKKTLNFIKPYDDLLWYDEMGMAIETLYLYNKKIIDDYNIVVAASDQLQPKSQNQQIHIINIDSNIIPTTNMSTKVLDDRSKHDIESISTASSIEEKKQRKNKRRGDESRLRR